MEKRKFFWLVTTEHLEDSLWFRDDRDFKVGMNFVAVQAAAKKAFVIAFILMSNHVHFVLYGTYEDALGFINRYKMRYSKYLRREYGTKEFLRENRVDIRMLPLGEEAVERAIAYVHMNPVAANICSNPGQYPWGSGSVLFDMSMPEGILIRDISSRRRAGILHSTLDVPGDWILGRDGYILPSSYLAKETAESLFRTPKRMNFFLASSSKARKKIESGEENLPSFRDQIISAAIPDLCHSLFGSDRLDDLSDEEKGEVLRQIRYRFSSNVNQIARVAGLSYSSTADLLDQM